jgi:uncharacterized membrane protein
MSSAAPRRLAAMSPRQSRLESIDIVRGAIMIIMMLDHTRDFVSGDAFHFNPTDLTRTTAPLFFTRWITHFCAPLFVFLAGVSIHLQRGRGKPIGELSAFLVKRGLWLVVLEVSVIRVIKFFNVVPPYLATLQVIWVLGIAMIVMAGLVRLPVWVSAVFGVATIALHNLLDGIQVAPWTPAGPAPAMTDRLWILLHQGGFMPLGSGPRPYFNVLYSLIPWVGVMALGYAVGHVYSWDASRRQRLLVRVGAACIVLFIVLRSGNVYGDPSLWARQSRPAMTLVSFLNTTKYPASLLYLLMTLGPGLIALAAAEGWQDASRLKTPLVTLGRVPLFYYLLQWLTAHVIAVVLSLAAGKSVAYLFMSPPDTFVQAPADAGFSLPVVWASWIAGVVLLYPICRWYAGVKARRKDWWLSYM